MPPITKAPAFQPSSPQVLVCPVKLASLSQREEVVKNVTISLVTTKYGKRKSLRTKFKHIWPGIHIHNNELQVQDVSFAGVCMGELCVEKTYHSSFCKLGIFLLLRCWLHDGEWLFKGPILAILLVGCGHFV